MPFDVFDLHIECTFVRGIKLGQSVFAFSHKVDHLAVKGTVMGITACHARTRLWGTDGENVIVSILQFLIDCVTIRNQTEKNIFWLITLARDHSITKQTSVALTNTIVTSSVLVTKIFPTTQFWKKVTIYTGCVPWWCQTHWLITMSTYFCTHWHRPRCIHPYTHTDGRRLSVHTYRRGGTARSHRDPRKLTRHLFEHTFWWRCSRLTQWLYSTEIT